MTGRGEGRAVADFEQDPGAGPDAEVMIDAIGQAVDIIERVTGSIDSVPTHPHSSGPDGSAGNGP